MLGELGALAATRYTRILTPKSSDIFAISPVDNFQPRVNSA
jgi:hypothetical protein